ncbi:MAG: hypothetical protein H7245_14205, partial [Candidatus Saccharibacteria bacterium]|nr:hypothetical protein [Pseudorhodobacter sp.]
VTPRAALAAMAAGAALLALAPNWLTILAGGTVFGIGYGSVAALFNGRILAAFGPRGMSMMALINALYSVGAIAAPLIFVGLGSDPVVIFGIITGLTVLTIVGAGATGGTTATGAVNRSGLRLHLPILAFGAIGIGLEASLVGLSTSAMIRDGIPADMAAALLSAFFVAFLLGRIALTLLADRVPPFAIYLCGVGFTAFCALGCALFDPVWAFPPMGASVGLFFPGFFATATRKMGTDARVAPIVLGTCQFGVILLPLIVTQASLSMGDKGFFWLMAGIGGTMTLLALIFYRPMAR